MLLMLLEFVNCSIGSMRSTDPIAFGQVEKIPVKKLNI